MYQFRSALLWVSTAILVCLPALLAIDFGGVLRWSQYIAAIAVLLAAAVSLAGLFDSSASTMLSQHKLLIPLGIFVAFVWFQTIELSPGFVSILSGGSYEAYMDWTKGLLPGELRPTSFAVSISPSDTAHAAAFLTVMLALVFASSLAFHSRSRLVVLLSAIALAGLSVAVVGVFRKLNPDADLWFIQPKTTAFGGFVNRNNAALMLNLGLGASFGLLSWRMMVLHSVEFDDPEFEFNDLIALVSDRESFIGIVSAAGCTAGLLVNGSRGGVVAALVGILFAFGYVRPRRGKISIPVLLVVIAISVAVLTVPLKLDLESISRLQLLSEKADTIQNDGRLQHWQDGLRASLAYLPLGAGLSTYRFAYLPFQNQSPGAWFTHADNLWLELLVETGFVGIFVVLTFLLMVMISLRRLGESVDPLDQGIRVAAWYGLGAIVASQWFDFGLLLPANLITVLLLATAVVSRDTANGGPAIWRHLTAEHRQAGTEASSDSLPRPAGGTASPQVMGVKLNPAWFSIWLKRPRWWGHVRRIGGVVVAAVVLLAGYPVLSRLRRDAEVESFTRRVSAEYPELAYQTEGLQQVVERLEKHVRDSQDPDAQTQLASVHRDLGRLSETMEWRPETLNDAVRIHRDTNLDQRRLPYPPSVARQDRSDLDSQHHYLTAHQIAVESMAQCPLSQQSRAMLVQLQPVVLESEAATKAVEHLVHFYSGEPNRLLLLGKHALANGQTEQARLAYRRAIVLNPYLTRRIMPLFLTEESLSLIDVIPDDPIAMKMAAETVIGWDEPDNAFLLKAVRQIDCTGDELLEKRAACNDLLARIYLHLDQLEKSLESYLAAIRLDPTEPRYRLAMIQTLFDAGRTKESLSQARMGRQLLPQNQQFQAWVDKIAAFDRRLVPTSGDGLQRLPSADSILRSP